MLSGSVFCLLFEDVLDLDQRLSAAAAVVAEMEAKLTFGFDASVKGMSSMFTFSSFPGDTY